MIDGAEIAEVQASQEKTPQAEITDQEVVRQNVAFWENKYFPTGDQVLKKGQEMLQYYRFAVTKSSWGVYCHLDGSSFRQKAQGMARLEERVAQAVGIFPNRKFEILMAPYQTYCPRGGGTDSSGDRIILDASSPDTGRVFVHERIHSLLEQAYGFSPVADLTEGAAMYFSRKVFPLDPRNDYESYPTKFGHQDFYEDLVDQKNPMGISHTAHLDRVKAPLGIPAYEYSYVFGGFLAKYITEKYGQEKYLEFYKKTCQPNLFSTDSGRKLIANHQLCPGVKNREVIYQALKSVGLDPVLCDNEFSKMVHQIAESKSNSVYKRIRNFMKAGNRA
ncbi:MAG: hypothetical protein Q8Q24_00985 [bacterium]|nr:hypothetical protein [bacterium]